MGNFFKDLQKKVYEIVSKVFNGINAFLSESAACRLTDRLLLEGEGKESGVMTYFEKENIERVITDLEKANSEIVEWLTTIHLLSILVILYLLLKLPDGFLRYHLGENYHYKPVVHDIFLSGSMQIQRKYPRGVRLKYLKVITVYIRLCDNVSYVFWGVSYLVLVSVTVFIVTVYTIYFFDGLTDIGRGLTPLEIFVYLGINYLVYWIFLTLIAKLWKGVLTYYDLEINVLIPSFMLGIYVGVVIVWLSCVIPF